MGTRHLHWILTGPSFAVHNPDGFRLRVQPNLGALYQQYTRVYCTYKRMLCFACTSLESCSGDKYVCHTRRMGLMGVIRGSWWGWVRGGGGNMTTEVVLLNFLGAPRNRLQRIDSASLCSLGGQYDNPIPTRFLAPHRLF
jgi:hypothetical protein